MDYMETCRTGVSELARLDVSDCRLGPEAALALVGAVPWAKSALRHLDLSDNPCIIGTLWEMQEPTGAFSYNP